MSKLYIEEHPIGTTAEYVDYTNNGMNGIANAKAALDNLQTRLANVEQGGSSAKPVSEIGVLQCFGDSITTDAETRPVAYPRILAALFGAELDRHSVGGANAGALPGYVESSRTDGDVATIFFGTNDASQINSHTASSNAISGTRESGYYSLAVNADNAAAIADSGIYIANKKTVSVTITSIVITHNGTDTQIFNGSHVIENGWGMVANTVATVGQTNFENTYHYRVVSVDFSSVVSGDTIKVYYTMDSGDSGQVLAFNCIYRLGTVADAMAVAKADAATSSALNTFFWGRLRKGIVKLFNRSTKQGTLKVFVIVPYSPNSTSPEEQMNADIASFASAMASDLGIEVYGIKESQCLPYTTAAFIDSAHPNEIGQVVLANTLYTRIKELI